MYTFDMATHRVNSCIHKKNTAPYEPLLQLYTQALSKPYMAQHLDQAYAFACTKQRYANNVDDALHFYFLCPLKLFFLLYMPIGKLDCALKKLLKWNFEDLFSPSSFLKNISKIMFSINPTGF